MAQTKHLSTVFTNTPEKNKVKNTLAMMQSRLMILRGEVSETREADIPAKLDYIIGEVEKMCALTKKHLTMQKNW